MSLLIFFVFGTVIILTRAEVERQLEKVTYADAIKRYAKLKDQFIREYSEAIEDASQEQANTYIQEFVNTINDGNFQGRSFALANELFSEVEERAVQAMDEDTKNALTELSGDYTKKYGELSNKAKKLLKEQVENLYDIQRIHNFLQEKLNTLAPNDGGVDASDLLNQVKGYLAQKLYYNNVENGDANFRKDIVAGYFEEALIHGATSKLTSHLADNIVGSQAIGSKKITLGTGQKVDSIYDEFFSFLKKDLSATFEESIDVDSRQLAYGFGAQSKLWNAPWKVQRPVFRRSITTNADLYSLWDEKKSWIQGVIFLEKHLSKVFGDNVMYVLGNQLYWTTDFISEARANDYFVAFHHDGDKFTEKVNIETIDMSKPHND